MSYTIDVYYRRLQPTHNIFHFFSFLSLFPQLVAGPIVRAADLLPQLKKPKIITETMRWHGLKLIALGYFKKTVLADNIGPFVNNAFSNEINNSSTIYWWLVMIGFTFQIYCDFSGYSDIARGLAKWMGLHFKVNFNHPYLAKSMREFWQRWHISLSSWFRDYVYKPLGGSRNGGLRSVINLWVTFLLSGLWHGAGITFIIWGAVHASYLSVERFLKGNIRVPIPKLIAIPVVFIMVILAWVFFRAETVHQAINILQNMLSFNRNVELGNPELFCNALIFILFLLLVEFLLMPSLPFIRKYSNRTLMKWGDIITVAFLLLASIFLRGSAATFIYFQF